MSTTELTNLFLFALFLAICSGCTEPSEILHANATIVSATHNKPKESSGIGITVVKVGPFGIDLSGDPGVRVGGGLQVSDSTKPERFSVVFQWNDEQHTEKGKNAYDKYKNHVGEKVNITYRNIYLLGSQNGKELINRDIIDITFK